MITITEDQNERIDKYLANELNIPRSKVKTLIESENILVNKEITKPKYMLNKGDVIKITYPKTKIEKENIPLDIIYEDKNIIILNKESGIVVHPGAGVKNKTLVNALLNYTNLSNSSGEERQGIVHRLDKDTSGLMIIAKTNEAHNKLSGDFKERKVIRKYTALCRGVIKEETGEINAPIGRDPKNRQKMNVQKENSKEAITKFKVLERYQKHTLVEFSLITGRTHQIRVHAKFIKHPIENDPLYTDQKSTKYGQYLHASYLEFNHPITNKKLNFSSDIPKEMKEAISKMRNFT